MDFTKILNEHCQCITLDRDRFSREWDSASAFSLEEWLIQHPHSISQFPAFLATQHALEMATLIRTIEDIVALPGYQAQVLHDKFPELTRTQLAERFPENSPHGVFFGYDFHISDQGAQLIEINTNAAGGMMALALAKSQTPCCEETMLMLVPTRSSSDLEATYLDMFREEHRRLFPTKPLQTIAIVDHDPTQQFFYPEFLLFQRLFEQAGWRALILDPSALSVRDNALWTEDTRIDLVYNRLTDFYLTEPQHHPLRLAYELGLATITPNPRAYALYADKRNLATLSDSEFLHTIGASSDQQTILHRGIPETHIIQPREADQWWTTHKEWFFKPFVSYGGKASYRGDKLTRSTFDAIIRGQYIAQRVVPPNVRVVEVNGEKVPLKMDIRNYVYAGDVQLLACRLYQGQTTNFRTSGGGLASVFATGSNG